MYTSTKIKSVLLILISSLTLSCSTMHASIDGKSYGSPSAANPELIKGDFVIIKTHDGELHEFEVVSITSDSVVGKDKKVLISNIYSLEIRAGFGKQLGYGFTEVFARVVLFIGTFLVIGAVL